MKESGLKESELMIIHFLWSGPKRSEELVKLLEGKVPRPTVFRRLKSLLSSRNKIIYTRMERRNGKIAVYYFLIGREKHVLPPYAVASQELIDKRLTELENVLDFGMPYSLKLVKKSQQEFVKFMKSSEETEDEKRGLLKPFAQGEKRLARSHFELLLTESSAKFGELCSKYIEVTRNQNLFRIIKILDRAENFNDGSLSITVNAFLTLVDHADQRKESPMLISAIKTRLDKLQQLCLTRPIVGFQTLTLIQRISQKKAKETLLKMIGVEKYLFEDLMDKALRFYTENLNKLKTDLDKCHSKSNPKTKKMVGEFWARLQRTLLEARSGSN